MNESEEDIIGRGIIASAILDTPEHMAFYENMKQLTLECIGNTDPQNHAERETLYYRYKAIEELIVTLQTYKFKAEQIVETREQANSGPSPDESIFD